ncbi:MAG: carbon monoxide dehydrogenase [Deltaproteobacteria bacterium]|jgi:carbon-monoxide dehydrogenase catalytic subunit|nr:carbon monoxide dehydrogenase [Deltaproteobacteria bacterium]
MSRVHNHKHDITDCSDYLAATAKYKKSFPNKKEVESQTPDQAVRETLRFFEQQGIESVFDRFDKQKPQCNFGLAGACCRNCVMGPCKITAKSPKGVCGADKDLIAARGLLRMIAAGAAAHGCRGRETMLALRAAALGELKIPIEGEEKVRKSAKALGIKEEGRELEKVALDLANLLLEDLSRTVPAEHKSLKAFASKERVEVWEKEELLPISAAHEVFEALHRTTTGTDGDWRNVMKQFHRCGLAFAFSCVLGSSIAMDSLLGPPRRGVVRCNLGALEKNNLNIAVHGHSPILVSEILKQGRSPKFVARAKKLGAQGVSFYGICCSGLSALYRYGQVIPLSNAVGAELVLGTGALDLWVCDLQDVLPSIMEVADCFKTTVVVTNDSGRLPGAEFFGYDHYHSNLEQTQKIATAIVNRALKSFSNRQDVNRNIPNYEAEAEIGFSLENIVSFFAPKGGLSHIVQAMKEEQILGIVNLVGCSNPRVLYEKAVYETALKLIENNVLVLTNGCASFPLLKLGLCCLKGAQKAGAKLRSFLDGHLPPVWHMGECLDNARASAFFKGLAETANLAIKDMPFAFASPEWSNEKGLAAATSFRLLGLNSYHCVEAPILVSENLRRYLTEETTLSLGSAMIVEVEHLVLADRIISDLKLRRKNLIR